MKYVDCGDSFDCFGCDSCLNSYTGENDEQKCILTARGVKKCIPRYAAHLCDDCPYKIGNGIERKEVTLEEIIKDIDKRIDTLMFLYEMETEIPERKYVFRHAAVDLSIVSKKLAQLK